MTTQILSEAGQKLADALDVIENVTDIPKHKLEDAQFLRGVVFVARDYARAASQELSAALLFNSPEGEVAGLREAVTAEMEAAALTAFYGSQDWRVPKRTKQYEKSARCDMRRALFAATAVSEPGKGPAAGVGVEPFTVGWFRDLFAVPLWNVPHWQRDVLMAVTALASQQPAVQGPVAAGVEDHASLREALVTACISGNPISALGHVARDNLPAILAVLASTTSPADPKTPDAGVGTDLFVIDWFRSLFADPLWKAKHWQDDVVKAVGCLLLAQPAPAGEDETGVREAATAAWNALSDAASPGEWTIYSEPVADYDEAKEEALRLVRETENLGSHMVMLNASGSCPALTGCGPRANANALLIANLVNGWRRGDFALVDRSLAPQPPKAETPAGVVLDGLTLEQLIHNYGAAEHNAAVDANEGAEPEHYEQKIAEAKAKLMQGIAALSTAPAARPGDEVGELGRFDHHPDPAIDFCIEVEVIEGLHYDHKVGASDGAGLAERVARAMTFRVGGDEIAVRAKHTLRGIEAALAAAPAADGGRG